FFPAGSVISIVSVDGKVLQQVELTTQESGTIELDVTNLKPGMYLLQLSDGQWSQTLRFIRK
ncbi:MAG: T9SS type A sorting domain-containing protein, partial [Bacteroidota bacterium]